MAEADKWFPFAKAWDLPDETMIVGLYGDMSGGEILIKTGGTFVDLEGEPSSMFADLEQFQVIGVERTEQTAELLASA